MMRFSLVLMIVGAIGLARAGTAAGQEVSFWLETRGLAPPDVAAIARRIEGMAGDGAKLVQTRRRERASLLLRVRLGSRHAESAESELSFPMPEVERASPDEGDSAEDRTAGPTQHVRLELVDIDGDEKLFEREISCRPRIVQANRIADYRLRAELSHVVSLIKEHGKADVAPPDIDSFGPSPAERERLSSKDRATALYRAAADVARQGYDEAALRLMAEAQPLLKQAGELRQDGLAWEHLARLMATTGRETAKAVAYAGQAVKIARELGDARTEAWALDLLAFTEARAGHGRRGLRVARSAGALARQTGDELAGALAVATEAAVSGWRGHWERAMGLVRRAAAQVDPAVHPAAAARIELATAAIQANVDERDRTATLAHVRAVRDQARALGDVALERDAAFVRAAVLYGTTNLSYLRDGVWEAVRAYRLARRLVDHQGEVAARALLGAFLQRLGETQAATEYLFNAHQQAKAVGFTDIATDSLELLATNAPDARHAVPVLERVLVYRRETGDLRGQIKVLSDLSRLHAGLGEDERAWERYREALDAVQEYVKALRADPDREDIRGGLPAVLKSLMATRTEPAFLARFLYMDRMMVVPNSLWRGEKP